MDDKVEIPRAWLERLLTLADAIYVYDNNDDVAFLKGYIESARDTYGLAQLSKEDV